MKIALFLACLALCSCHKLTPTAQDAGTTAAADAGSADVDNGQ